MRIHSCGASHHLLPFERERERILFTSTYPEPLSYPLIQCSTINRATITHRKKFIFYNKCNLNIPVTGYSINEQAFWNSSNCPSTLKLFRCLGPGFQRFQISISKQNHESNINRLIKDLPTDARI